MAGALLSTLPLTVTSVEPVAGGLWKVTVAMADGTSRHMLIPETLATIEAVKLSSLALAQLLNVATTPVYHHHHGHRHGRSRT